MNRPLGISSTMLGPDLTASELSEAADRGITHLEIFVRAESSLLEDKDEVLQVAERIAEAGMVPWSVHAPFGGEVDLSAPDELKRRASVGTIRCACSVAEYLGARWVVAHAGIRGEDPEEDERRSCQSLRSINCLLAHMSLREIGLAIEYLPGSKPRLWNESGEILETLELLDGPPSVCLDTNHANLSEPLSDAVRALGASIGTLHISDNDGEQEMHQFPGEGVIDWPGFVDALDAVGYAGPLIYEARMEGNVSDHLEMTASTAREQLGWEPADARKGQ